MMSAKDLTSIERSAMKLIIQACDHTSILMVTARYAGRYSDVKAGNRRQLAARLNAAIKDYTGNEALRRVSEAEVTNVFQINDLIPIVTERLFANMTALRYLHPIQALDMYKSLMQLITTLRIDRFEIDVYSKAGERLTVKWCTFFDTSRHPEVRISRQPAMDGTAAYVESYETLAAFAVAYGITQ
jgi:hypothetical protein